MEADVTSQRFRVPVSAGSVGYKGLDGRLVIGSYQNCEVGEGGASDGRRPDDGLSGDAGIVFAPGMATGPSGGVWGIRGPRSPSGSPRDATVGAPAGPTRFTSVGLGLLVTKTAGEEVPPTFQ